MLLGNKVSAYVEAHDIWPHMADLMLSWKVEIHTSSDVVTNVSKQIEFRKKLDKIMVSGERQNFWEKYKSDNFNSWKWEQR